MRPSSNLGPVVSMPWPLAAVVKGYSQSPHANRQAPKSRICLRPTTRLCFNCAMEKTSILRIRIDPRRKARVEKILSKLGITPTQAVNMFFAQVESRRGLPFPVSLQDNSDILPPDEHYAVVMKQNDQ